jgi:hypothetical protein
LGFQTRRVWLLAWLTALPVTVCFPQISQVRDMISFPLFPPEGPAGKLKQHFHLRLSQNFSFWESNPDFI